MTPARVAWLARARATLGRAVRSSSFIGCVWLIGAPACAATPMTAPLTCWKDATSCTRDADRQVNVGAAQAEQTRAASRDGKHSRERSHVTRETRTPRK